MKPAVILFSHGSLLCGAGEQLEAHAERLRETREYSRVEAGYLTYSSPSFSEAVGKCATAGATKILIAPYFLVPGYFVQVGLPKVLAPAKQRFSEIEFQIAPVLGDHPLLAQAVIHCARRAATSENWRAILHCAPQFCESDVECPLFEKCHEGREQQTGNRKQETVSCLVPPASCLLLMVHGSPKAESNDAIFRVAEQIRAASEYSHVTIGFMECNAPSIPDAIKNLVANGAQTIVAMPYFLHAGKHVADDLPNLLEQAQQEYSGVELLLGDYLGNEPLIADVLRARLDQVTG
jgi:sirohydrochlorin cobaltochelatase